MDELNKLPSWVGSVPAWSTLLLVIGWISLQWLKNKPILNQQAIDERLGIKSGYLKRIETLEGHLRDQKAECDERETRLLEQIDVLKERLSNEALQRVQGEISLIQILLEVVPAPQLKTILATLEARQVRLQAANVQMISEPGAGAEDDEVDSERS